MWILSNILLNNQQKKIKDGITSEISKYFEINGNDTPFDTMSKNMTHQKL